MFTGGKTTNAFKQGTFRIQACEPKVSQETTFLDGLKKISGLEIGNKTFDNLKTIAKISDLGQTGTIVGDGVDWVFDKMKWPLPDQMGSVVKNFNPQVANAAIGASKQIAQKVKQRDFKVSDIPEYLQDMGNFEALLSGIFVPKKIDEREFTKCEAIDYAIDFAKDYGMKYKFLFVVEFVPHDAYAAAINGGINPAAFVKDFTIPQINIEHEEVNMYNVRTKVPKFINFTNANMVFYDDGRNNVMTMISNYLKTMSPAFRSDDPLFIENNGRSFADVRNSSSIRVLDDSSGYAGLYPTSDATKNIFKEIRVYHVFFSGHYFNMYSFMNPRFSNIAIEQLSMEANAVSVINAEFNYDTMYIETNRPFYSDKHSSNLATSSKLNTGIKFKGEGPPGAGANNNEIDVADPVDGSILGGLLGQATNANNNAAGFKNYISQKTKTAIGGTSVAYNAGLHTEAYNYSQLEQEASNDSETLNSAAKSAADSGDMSSANKYTELANKKSKDRDENLRLYNETQQKIAADENPTKLF